MIDVHEIVAHNSEWMHVLMDVERIEWKMEIENFYRIIFWNNNNEDFMIIRKLIKKIYEWMCFYYMEEDKFISFFNLYYRKLDLIGI